MRSSIEIIQTSISRKRLKTVCISNVQPDYISNGPDRSPGGIVPIYCTLIYIVIYRDTFR